jgi:predicted Zn-dependent protease with MMP-like domain
VLLLQAACAREAGNVEEALALLSRTALADPEWATPEIWAAELIAGDPERLAEALDHATRALDRAEEEDEYLEALAVKAGIEVDLGKLGAARRTLAELPPPEVATASTDPAWELEVAHLLLAVGDVEQAQQRFSTLTAAHANLAEAWHGAGLAAEVLGDEEGKRQAWLRTLALDQQQPMEDPLLSEVEMQEVAEEALGELPERARALIENVPIVIANLPVAEDVRHGLDPRLLGLFEGGAYPDASSVGGPPQLARILLFRKNLERVAADEDELRDEIRTTLLHETGHFFGMSEEDLAGVGLD